MNYESEFVRLYNDALELYDCSQDSAFARRQVGALFGTPSTLKYTETTLVGTALVNPSDPDVAQVLREIAPSDLRYARYKEIWAACQATSGMPDLGDREETLRRTAYQIWTHWKRPTCQLPESACHAIILSSQFVSSACIKSLARQYNEVRAETLLRRRILEIASDFRDEEMTAKSCLDQLCALREEVAVYGL